MDTLITACIRSCGHAKFYYDCVYVLDKYPLCRCVYGKDDIYVCL